ncbi:MAG: branched-chain amino acid transaminase [Candidatus Micrarchaeota archaeon]
MSLEFDKIWMDGNFVDHAKAKVHILTHALHYGTAIFEGIRCYETKNGPAIFRLEEHIDRLYRGAKIYNFKIPYSKEELANACKMIIKKNKIDSAYIRPIVYLGYKMLGLDMEKVPVNVAIIAVKPFSPVKDSLKQVRCKISSWRRIKTTILSPHVKASANYLNSVLAKAEAKNCGYDEAIMLNEDGHVSEATGENVFIVNDNWINTPPLHDGVLSGITRDSILKIAKDLDYEVSEQSFFRDELIVADEVFLSGTAAEIVGVGNVDGATVGNGNIGKITKTLMEKYDKIVHGKEKEYEEWLDYV